MQPTISIPQHWGYPRFALDQRTKDGIILGLQYYPNGTELAEQFGDGWRYALMLLYDAVTKTRIESS